MAQRGVHAPSSKIACLFCLEVFDDATQLACGHTFCQSCLDKYDHSHQDLDHMVCPICRKTTMLDEKRVAGLPKNITVNGMVEEYLTHGEIGPVDKGKPKCTACELEDVAVSFCTSCGYYMCDKCHHGHQQFLTSFFKGHCVLSMKDITEQRLILDHFSDKCSEHKRDLRDLFCEDCKVYVCFKCTIVGHRDHNIINRPEFEDQLQKRVKSLLERCHVKLSELEKSIIESESQRPHGHIAFQRLQVVVEDAIKVKVDKLKENRDKLFHEVDEMQRIYDKELDVLKALDKQMIEGISRYASLIDNDKLRHLERDSLTTHYLTCKELDVLLETPKDVLRANILEFLQEKRFLHADAEVFDLGKFSDLKIITQLDLPYNIEGMAPKGATGVVIIQKDSVNEVHSDGRHQDMKTPTKEKHYYDIALLGHDKFILSGSNARLYVFSIGESLVSGINLPITHGGIIRLDTSCLGEILIARNTEHFQICDPSSQKITHTIQTTHYTRQAFAMKSGLVVTSSCNISSPSTVRVYDRDGCGGDTLRASKGEYLYPAVDCNDRVFVASINQQSGTVQITLYDLEGLNLKERLRCDDQKLTLGSTTCYLVSLPHNVLAFACEKKLYFIKFPYSLRYRQKTV